MRVLVAGLCFSRAMVGLGEGVAPSAATDMVARVIVKACHRRMLPIESLKGHAMDGISIYPLQRCS